VSKVLAGAEITLDGRLIGGSAAEGGQAGDMVFTGTPWRRSTPMACWRKRCFVVDFAGNPALFALPTKETPS